MFDMLLMWWMLWTESVKHRYYQRLNDSLIIINKMLYVWISSSSYILKKNREKF